MFSLFEGEIQIFGEPVCLKITLLKAGTSLKYPVGTEFATLCNPGQEPTEDIIFLNYVWRQAKLTSAA